MKKLVPVFFIGFLFTLPVCKGQPIPAEFKAGPVKITVRPDFQGADYEIIVDPWQVDVANGGDLEWNLVATGGIDVEYEINSKQGPWGPDKPQAQATDKRVGPINHPGGGQLAKGRYNILLRITEDGELTVIRLDPDHRVWP